MSQYIGEAATSLSNIPTYLGGSQISSLGQFGQYMSPANQGLFGSGGLFDMSGPAGTALSPPSSMDPGTGPVPSGTPGAAVGPVPGATSAGSFPSAPAPMAESTIDPITGIPGPMNPINASGFGSVPPSPATTAALNAPPGDPQSAFMQWLTGDVTGAKGALRSPVTALGSLGGIMEAVNRWQTMRTLQNPEQLAANANKLAQKMNKQTVARITAPTEAIMAETGGINAPGLYAQAIAQSLAPYNYESQQRAIQEYIQALQDSMQAYPQGGIYGTGGAAQQQTS